MIKESDSVFIIRSTSVVNEVVLCYCKTVLLYLNLICQFIECKPALCLYQAHMLIHLVIFSNALRVCFLNREMISMSVLSLLWIGLGLALGGIWSAIAAQKRRMTGHRKQTMFFSVRFGNGDTITNMICSNCFLDFCVKYNLKNIL